MRDVKELPGTSERFEIVQAGPLKLQKSFLKAVPGLDIGSTVALHCNGRRGLDFTPGRLWRGFLQMSKAVQLDGHKGTVEQLRDDWRSLRFQALFHVLGAKAARWWTPAWVRSPSTT